MTAAPLLSSLDELRITNRYLSLPADPIADNYTRQVKGACYSRVAPRRFSAPQRVAYSPPLAADLGLSEAICRDPRFSRVFSGQELLPGMEPYACSYGGHQFGHWAGQLGDGRAINLGEVITATGASLTLQLKGAGPTPYSRNADGLAVLRSSLREFLCSEAMAALGVPTTRALSLTLTGDRVVRDMLYDGHPESEAGAVVCRVAPSFLRFGNFELHARRDERALLQQLADFSVTADFAHLLSLTGKERYLAWFEEISARTLEMILHWLRVGFVHGVMNSDNMSILGLTIDYGPYGWVDDFDLDWTPNTTDGELHRYAFGRQPAIALWNLYKLANAIYPLIGSAGGLEQILRQLEREYHRRFYEMMAQKLGLARREKGDLSLIDELVQLLGRAETDMTLFFRTLSRLQSEAYGQPLTSPLRAAWYQPQQLSAADVEAIEGWFQQFGQRLQREDPGRDELRRQEMDRDNPKYVLRNSLAQQAIERATDGDYSELERLFTLLQHPYAEQPEMEQYAAKRPEWARHKVGCSMLSCSS
ncbi:MAG: YdiU family protein [Gammaproteobacteria bacterium]|nr:YdiU family protein [Gammaproteobacteria bacterium]